MCQLARPESGDLSQENANSVPQIRIPPAQPDSSKPVAAASPKDDSALSPEDGDQLIRLSTGEAEAAAAKVAEEWVCPRCTFSNKPADACEMCQLARPESGDLSQENANSVPQIRIPPAQPDSSKPVAAASPKDDSAVSPEDGDRDECVICMDKPRTHACIPCGHMLLCDGKGEDCQPHSVTMKQGCPLCTEPVTSIIRIFSR